MKTTVTVSHCHTLHSPINKQKSPKILHKSLYRNIICKIFEDFRLHSASVKVSSDGLQSIIRRPLKYHPTAFKVSSVDLQSIIRWKAKYHPTEVHI